MIKNAIEFLRSTNEDSFINDEKALLRFAVYVEQFSKMVCEAKLNYLKTSIVDVMRNDILIKNMTDGKEGKSYFIGKELAHKHILQTMEEIKYTNHSDLDNNIFLNAGIKEEINLS